MQRAKRSRALRVAAGVAVAMGGMAATPADARITRIEITSVQPAFGGAAFGTVGGYERVIGRAHGEVDPAHPGNAIIQDIALAPRNARGMVEYATDVEILRPAARDAGNGVLFFDVVNRGGKRLLSLYNGAPVSNEPSNPGDGFLMRQGYTLIFFGWQPDILPGAGRMTMQVPVARHADGSPVTGVVRSEIVVQQAANTVLLSTGSFTGMTHAPYPTAATDHRAAFPDGFRPTLTMRARAEVPRQEVPADRWRFADCDGAAPVPSETRLCLDGGFQPGVMYELIYRAKDPTVLGLGYAAMRDLPAFLRHSRADDTGTPNPAARADGAVQTTVIHGTSQSGRNMRLFLHLGFNRDEAGRIAYDGMIPHVGGGLAAMNIRFAHPGRAWGQQIDNLYPAYDYPFAYTRVADPITGRNASVLDRCEATATCPRIFHVATALEMWEGRQSLGLTDPLGQRDLVEPANVRTYIMASTQHSAAGTLPRQAPFGLCQQQPNPMTHLHTMRALLTAMTGWLKDGTAPPASATPRITEATLVRAEAVNFPRIPANGYDGVQRPAVKFLALTNPLRAMDFGPAYNNADLTGIITQEPPRLGEREYGLLVPQVDADGNDIAGIRAVHAQVPRGTYTGWNLFRAGYFEDGFCSLQGSFIPFAATRAEREATGDPRPSLEERYPSKEAYVAAIRDATARLVAQRFLLAEDAGRFVAEAERDGLRPQR